MIQRYLFLIYCQKLIYLAESVLFEAAFRVVSNLWSVLKSSQILCLSFKKESCRGGFEILRLIDRALLR